jgi:hypothetical protein
MFRPTTPRRTDSRSSCPNVPLERTVGSLDGPLEAQTRITTITTITTTTTSTSAWSRKADPALMANDARDISFDFERILLNLQRLVPGHEGIPAGSEVSRITGTGGEPAADVFHQWLQGAAQQIGDATDGFRETVAHNAEALKQAAADLRAHDEISAADLQKYDSAVDATTSANPAPSPRPAAAPAPSTPATQAALNDNQHSAAGQL